MAIRVIDVRCEECHKVSELFVEDTTGIAYDCPACGGTARRIPNAPPFHLEGITGAFPTASDKWAIDHERAAKRRS